MFGMIGSYNQRLVDNTKFDGYEVDTVYVTDRPWSYETAVKHNDFNGGDWVIVGSASTKEGAKEAHDYWCKVAPMLDNWQDIFSMVTYWRGK